MREDNSISGRLSKIRGFDPRKWLSEGPAEDKAQEDAVRLGGRLGGNKETIAAKRPEQQVNRSLAMRAQSLSPNASEVMMDRMQAVADAEKLSGRGAPAAKAKAKAAAAQIGIRKKGGILQPPEEPGRLVGVAGDPVPETEGGRPAKRAAGARSTPEAEVRDISSEVKDLTVEGVPEFKHEQLGGLNDYVKRHKDREDNGWYHDQAKERAAENSLSTHYTTDHGINTKFDDEKGAAELMSWAANDNNEFKRSLKPMWQEVENFHNNFSDESLRDENNYQEIIKRTRHNEISDEVLDTEWNKLSNKDKKALGEMGFGGAGGRAQKLSPEEKLERGRAILRVYLQQGGRDGYLGGENTAPISWKDMTVDHVHPEGDTEFWKQKAIEKGFDPEDYLELANDPNENYVMTRFGFNGAQKRDNSMEDLYSKMESEYYQKGQDHVENEVNSTREKALRKVIREDEYYKPVVDLLKQGIASGLEPEAYNELWEFYQKGRKQIEDNNGPRTNGSQMIMDRNEYTDAWRSLAEQNLLGMKIFAQDGLRAKEGGQIAGWSGVGGTTSGSNAADGEHPSYPFEDSALDFYFDPMRRLKLGGKEGEADAIHKFTQFLGNAFVTGKIDSEEWQGYLKAVSQMAMDRLPDEWRGEHDGERSDEYLETINRTLNKLNGIKPTIGKGTKKDPKKPNPDFKTDEGLLAPNRSIKKLFKSGQQQSLADSAIETMKALMNPEDSTIIDYYDQGNLYESLANVRKSVIIEGKLKLL